MSASLALVSLTRTIQPMGLVYLGSWIQHHVPNCEVTIVDSHWVEPLDVLLRRSFDYIGISAVTATYEKASRLARELKYYGRRTPVIIGGPHITALPQSVRPEFDILVSGEGEWRLKEILIGQNMTRPSLVDLTDYPDLDFGLLDARYWKAGVSFAWPGEYGVLSYLITARGCPFRCRFCAASSVSPKYRPHSVEWVLRQMHRLSDLGVTHFSLWDDLFCSDKSRVREMAERYSKSEFRNRVKGLAIQTRAEVTDDEICDLLASMGVRRTCFGFESGSDRMLHWLKKGRASVAINKSALSIARRRRINPVGTMIIGNPTETFWDGLKTVWFMFTSGFKGVIDMIVFVAVPLPGTEYWDIAKARGKVADQMDFNRLQWHTKWPKHPMMLDMPTWQFYILWCMAQLALLPMKARKAAILAWAWLRRIV